MRYGNRYNNHLTDVITAIDFDKLAEDCDLSGVDISQVSDWANRTKELRRTYRHRPDVLARRRELYKVYSTRPEFKEYKKQKDAEYYSKHKEAIKARTKAWAQAHADKVREYKRKYKERKKQEKQQVNATADNV